MIEPTKIALCGRMRSGKDTIARHLYFEHGFYEPLAFGSALKFYAHQIFFDIDREPKPRELYQFMNVMRDYDPDVWIKHLAISVRTAEDIHAKGIVVTDARQENEIDWLREHGFVIVRVETPEDERVKRIELAGDIADESALSHKTESYVDEIVADYTLVNDGTIDDLLTKVDELVAKIKEGE